MYYAHLGSDKIHNTPIYLSAQVEYILYDGIQTISSLPEWGLELL